MNNSTDKVDVTKLAQISVNTGFMRRLADQMYGVNRYLDGDYPGPKEDLYFSDEEICELLVSCDIAEDLHAALIEDIGLENF